MPASLSRFAAQGVGFPTFPLQRAAGKRYLVDQNGVPFFGSGDAAWFIATIANLATATAYLADRRSRGTNMLVIEAIDNIENASGIGANANGHLPFNSKQGGGSYTNSTTQSPDFTTPNSSYWSDLDARLNLVASYGFLVLLYPIWLGDPIGDPTDEGYYNALAATSSGNRQAFGAFVAGRYGAGGTNPIKGLIWGIGGDANVANGASITAINNDVAAGILSVDSHALMFADGLDGTSMIDAWGGQTWFQVNGIYTDEQIGKPWTYAQCKSEYQNTSGLQSFYPQFQKEGCYEGDHSATPQFVRSQTWQSLLGGCWGFVFGNGGTDPVYAFAGDSGWTTGLASRGAQDSQVATTFFKSRRWDLLVPDFDSASFLTNSGSYSNATWASAAVASDGSWGAVYVPTTESLTIDLAAFSGAVVAKWIDPTSGAPTPIGSFSNSGSHTFTPPSSNAQGDADFVLVFE